MTQDPPRSEKVAAFRTYLDELDEQTRLPGEPPLREAVAAQARERLAELPDNDAIFGPPRHRAQSGECTRCGQPWPCESVGKGSSSAPGGSS